MQCTAVLLASVLAMAASSAVNYCGSRMCGNTNDHTFCQYPEGPSPECVGYISAHLTLEEKSRLIARLNRRRNEAAAGRMRDLPSAGNMIKLRWVEELAREAQRWADQCRPPRTPEEHDSCRDLYSLTVGQCVASVVGEAPGLRVESMVDIWYMQSMLYKGNVTFYVPPSPNASFYGDFAQIIWARSYMVGCGRSRFMTPMQGRLRSVERLVCNFAPHGPPPSRPLWAPAAPAASCPPRSEPDSSMDALCNFQPYPQEITVIDDSMSLEEHLLLNTVLEIENNDTMNYLGSLDEIYLTKVAIATMENIFTTQTYYNSMQRRDVVEVIDMKEVLVNISTTAFPFKVILAPNITLPPDTTTKALKTTKRKINVIGRPRTYNMEDLTDFDDSTENNTPLTEIPKKGKEFYAEYEFVEPVEEDTTTTVVVTNATEVPTIINVILNQDVLRQVATGFYPNSSMLFEGAMMMLEKDRNKFFNVSNGNDTLDTESHNSSQVGNTTSTIKDNIDEYLSDPETVRELQDALEQIEQDMSRNAEKQGKVRRELRDSPGTEPATTLDKDVSDEILQAELERNKSLERGPMYNMVLKYMPYLKQYEGSLLPKPLDSSSSYIVVSNIVLVLNVFVIV